MKKLYDPQCYELAKAFLLEEPLIDSEEAREELASDIQRTIEDFIFDAKGGDS